MLRAPTRTLRTVAAAGLLLVPMALGAPSRSVAASSASAHPGLLARLFAHVARPAVVAGARAAVTGPTVSVFASGLNDPRHLRFGIDGALYIAEAGSGNNDGQVTRVFQGQQSVWATGFFSGASPEGEFAEGLADVAPSAPGQPGLAIPIFFGRLSADGVVQNSSEQMLPSPAGHVVHIQPNGTWTPTVDVSAFEYANNPVDDIDTDPYAIAHTNVNGLKVVADAAGNDLLYVNTLTNRVSLLAAFPDHDCNGSSVQSVPTSVVRGPDGAYYVGELTGESTPNQQGCARIYRVVPGQAPTIYATGFTNIIDLAWSRSTLYALQLTTLGLTADNPGPGALLQVNPGAAPTLIFSANQDHFLFVPTGFAIGPDRAFYVSNGGVCPANPVPGGFCYPLGGQVLRIKP